MRTLRSAGQEPWATYFEAQLFPARAIQTYCANSARACFVKAASMRRSSIVSAV
jgi:hypothetical protein